MIRKLYLPLLIALVSLLTSCESESSVIPNRVHSISDLGHKKVGVQIGNTADIYASDFGGDTAKIDVERYTKLADAVQALMQGKVDAVMSDDQPAKAFVRQNPSLRILEEVFVEEMYAGVVAKGNEALLDSVNQAIAQMKFDGVYDSIFNNYINHTSDYHYQKKVTEGPKLVVSTNAQFPPYEFYKDNKIVGLDIEIVNYIADYLHRTVEIQDIAGQPVQRPVKTVQWDISAAEKQGYPHYMLKEIFEQPLKITDTFRGRILEDEGQINLDEKTANLEFEKCSRIQIVACGTSYHAGLLGKYIIE